MALHSLTGAALAFMHNLGRVCCASLCDRYYIRPQMLLEEREERFDAAPSDMVGPKHRRANPQPLQSLLATVIPKFVDGGGAALRRSGCVVGRSALSVQVLDAGRAGSSAPLARGRGPADGLLRCAALD